MKENNMPQQQYYLYVHAYPSNHPEKPNQIFYVGKGKDKRYLNRWREYNPYHQRILNKLFRNGYKMKSVAYIIKSNLIEETAFHEETKLIRELGREDLNKGSLVNMTDGGDGVSGESEKTRKLKSDSLKEYYRSNPNLSVKTKTQILQLYKKNISKNAIAKKLKISFETVNDHIKKNVAIENPDGRSKSHNKLPIPLKEELELLYVTQSLPMTEIAKIFKTSNVTVNKWLKYHKINKRTHKENQQIQMKKSTEKYYNENNFYPSQKHIDKKSLELLNDIEWLKNENKIKSADEIANLLKVSPSLVLQTLHKNNIEITHKSTSQYENEIIDFLKEHGITNIEKNTRQVITPKELDIFLPDFNFAIEFDGIYWHSFKDKNYHIDKTNACKKQNIFLIHIFENEWLTKKDIWKSIILSKLQKISNRIFARKCEVRNVDRENTKKFLNENHLQGYALSTKNIGLYYNDTLVSLMTFGKPRFNKKYEWELIRFANKKYYTVIGGASKIFKSFNGKSILSYSDLRYSEGNLYKILGLKYSHTTSPNYFYFKNNSILFSRIKFQKHKLEKELDTFDINLTEYENMKNNGFRRIFDCGNLVFCSQ